MTKAKQPTKAQFLAAQKKTAHMIEVVDAASEGPCPLCKGNRLKFSETFHLESDSGSVGVRLRVCLKCGTALLYPARLLRRTVTL